MPRGDRSGSDSVAVRVVLMRGGTSKGVFLSDDDLPPEGPERDEFVLALMGSPDPMQIDGLGGTHSSTSKVVAVGPGRTAGVDVEYLFAQVGVDVPVVDYAGNCGNLTAAVAPYAIDEGLVTATEPVTRMTLLNRNTGARIAAEVPVVDGRAATTGDAVDAGVPGRGAPIRNEYLDPGGTVFGSVLPSGQVRERVETPSGGFEVSLVDVGHPIAFVRGGDLGLVGDEAPAALNGMPELLERLETLRAACAVRLGRAEAEQAGASPTVPRLVLLFAPAGAGIDAAGDARLDAIGISMGKVHHAFPLTSAICTAAAASLEGTLAWELAGVAERPGSVSISHPKGTVTIAVSVSDEGTQSIRSATVVRTARRLLEGVAFIPSVHQSQS